MSAQDSSPQSSALLSLYNIPKRYWTNNIRQFTFALHNNKSVHRVQNNNVFRRKKVKTLYRLADSKHASIKDSAIFEISRRSHHSNPPTPKYILKGLKISTHAKQKGKTNKKGSSAIIG